MDNNKITEDPSEVYDTVPTFSAAGWEQQFSPAREDNELPYDDTPIDNPLPPADQPTQPGYYKDAPYPPVAPPAQSSYPAAPPYPPPVNEQRQQSAGGTGPKKEQKAIIALLSVLVVLVLAVGGMIAYFSLRPSETTPATSAAPAQSPADETIDSLSGTTASDNITQTTVPDVTTETAAPDSIPATTVLDSIADATAPGGAIETTAAVGAKNAVSFSKWENADYTYIRATDASVGIRINTAGVLSQVGISLYNTSGNKLAGYDHIPTTAGNTKFFFKMNDEVKYVLSPATTYRYQCYAIVDGIMYFSDMYSFTTLSGGQYEGNSRAAASDAVSFSRWNDPDYTYIRATDASVGVEVTVAYGRLSNVGVELYDASGGKLTEYDHVPTTTGSRFFFEMNSEVGYVLSPGTTYRYRFYAVVGGNRYYSNTYSFTTTYSDY